MGGGGGAEGRCGSQMGDKISEGYKDKETYKSATFEPRCVMLYLFYQVCFLAS